MLKLWKAEHVVRLHNKNSPFLKRSESKLSKTEKFLLRFVVELGKEKHSVSCGKFQKLNAFITKGKGIKSKDQLQSCLWYTRSEYSTQLQCTDLKFIGFIFIVFIFGNIAQNVNKISIRLNACYLQCSQMKCKTGLCLRTFASFCTGLSKIINAKVGIFGKYRWSTTSTKCIRFQLQNGVNLTQNVRYTLFHVRQM